MLQNFKKWNAQISKMCPDVFSTYTLFPQSIRALIDRLRTRIHLQNSHKNNEFGLECWSGKPCPEHGPDDFGPEKVTNSWDFGSKILLGQASLMCWAKSCSVLMVLYGIGTIFWTKNSNANSWFMRSKNQVPVPKHAQTSLYRPENLTWPDFMDVLS